MEIAIYSGSFNPIHKGHIKLAEYMLAAHLVDEVWFVVSPCNPLKDKKELIDHFLRLDMVIAAIKNRSELKASDVEFDMPIPSYSIDTLNRLKENFPEHNFSLLVGSDNALVFDQWKNYSEILEKFKVFVYPRRDYDFSFVASRFPQMVLLDSPLYDVSSTQIRNAIAENQSINEWVDTSVIEYIEENELYRDNEKFFTSN